MKKTLGAKSSRFCDISAAPTIFGSGLASSSLVTSSYLDIFDRVVYSLGHFAITIQDSRFKMAGIFLAGQGSQLLYCT